MIGNVYNVNKNCLVIGYGSIGKRHLNILREMQCSVSLVSSQTIPNILCYSNIDQALNASAFDYIVIANPTYLHYQSLQQLLELHFNKIILVEKPLFSQTNFEIDERRANIFVGYNLRFHALLLAAKAIVKNEEMISFSARVGQYLPTWRKNINYQDGYSAKKNLGGGVLRELSHELDYAMWFCGSCSEVVATGGHFSELEIDSDDVFFIIMRCEQSPIVNVQLDFLSRVSYRDIRIQTKQCTIVIDFIAGTLHVNHHLKLKLENAMEKTYYDQHSAILSGNHMNCCDILQGLRVMRLIEAAELSVQKKQWIQL